MTRTRGRSRAICCRGETREPGTTTTARLYVERPPSDNGIVVPNREGQVGGRARSCRPPLSRCPGVLAQEIWVRTVGRSDFYQAFADRVENRLRAVVDLKLLVHVADVIADRLLADLQLVGDLLVGHPARQHLQDLDLANGEPVVELLGCGRAGEHRAHPAC